MWRTTLVKVAKSHMRNMTHAVGYEIRKFPKVDMRPLPVFGAVVALLDDTLEGNVSFLQVGANDGSYVDPLNSYITSRPWRGVLVEPQPDVFGRLVKTYQEQTDRLILENVAVGPNAELTLYSAAAAPGASDYASSVVSSDPKVVARQLRINISDLTAKTVPCVTVDELCAKHGITKLNLLQIDAEGYDWLVLKTANLSRLRPEVIQIETGHLSRKDCDAVAKRLAEERYLLYWGGHQGDAVAVHESYVATWGL